MEESFFGNEIDTGLDDLDEDCSGGIYRCRDDIANFKLRVRVRKIDPAGTILSSSAEMSGVEGSRESVQSTTDLNGETELQHDLVIGWQQKIFSPQEIAFYSNSKDDDFDTNVLKKKFYRDVQAMVKKDNSKSNSKSVVYTEIDGELSTYEDVSSICLFAFV